MKSRFSARVVTQGGDVTIVTWGNGVMLAATGVSRLAAQGIFCELIDLRWLSPWDRRCVEESVKKTGRLVVLQEDNLTSSYGAYLISEMVTNDELFGNLLAPPKLVSRADTHIPFHPLLEAAVLPSQDDVVNAVLSVF
jgi:2-oxoisovalerate dehydrogenase E1 component